MLKVKNLKKNRGGRQILESIDLELGHGEIGVILGESGSGKTTFLRCLSGLDSEYTGSVRIEGQEIFPNTPPSKRQLGYLFQNATLFPHLNVQKNIELSIMDQNPSDRSQRACEVMEICEISRYAQKLPQELSGGEQQRVALARSLAPKPKLILMDEPFSSLDPQLRFRLRDEVKKLLKSFNITCVMVSHDVPEAYFMADKMGILKDGLIQQWSTSSDIYHVPKDIYTAEYLETTMFLDVSCDAQGHLSYSGHVIGNHPQERNQSRLKLLVRPHNVIFDDHSPVKASVLRENFQGAHFMYELQISDGNRLYALSHEKRPCHPEKSVGIRFQFQHIICFHAD